MAENTNDSQVVETEEELTNYTTETNAGAGTGTSAIEPLSTTAISLTSPTSPEVR